MDVCPPHGQTVSTSLMPRLVKTKILFKMLSQKKNWKFKKSSVSKNAENFEEIFRRLSELKSNRGVTRFKTVEILAAEGAEEGQRCRKNRILKMMQFFLDAKWQGFDKEGKTDISTLRQIVRNCKLFNLEGTR